MPSVYQNPLRGLQGLNPERIDQGVDYGGTGNLYALGPGVVDNVFGAGWPGGTFIEYQLTGGPDAGKYVYAAEDIHPDVKVGQTIDSNTVLGQVYNGGSGIETGWANPDVALQQALGHSQWNGTNPTAYGADFNALLTSLGAPSGTANGPVQGSVPQGFSQNIPGELGNTLLQLGQQNTTNNLFNQAAQAGLLASQNEQYATQETGFQSQLNALNKQQLGIQEGALLRQYALAPKEYQLQLNQISREQGQADAQTAASGSRFTHGGRDTFAGLSAQKQQAGLSYQEQLASIRDQQANIGIQSQRYGISDQELQARLQNTLQNISGGYIQDVYSLTQQDIASLTQLASQYQGLPASAAYGTDPQLSGAGISASTGNVLGNTFQSIFG